MTGLKVRVRTRTKVQDYRFIGQPPPDRWWEARYGRWTDFSRPTVIVEPGKFFIAGIRSGRTDSKGAGIHYALLGVIEAPEGGDAAARLIYWVCEQLASTTPPSFTEVGERLDEISEETWAAAVKGEEAAEQEVDRKLASLVVALPDRPRQPEPATQKVWVRARDQAGFQKLAETAAIVVAGTSPNAGLAAYLNLASQDELDTLKSLGDHVGLVCRGGQPPPKHCAPHSGGHSSRWQESR